MPAPDTPPSLLLRLRDVDDHSSWQQFFEQYWRLIFSFGRKCGLGPEDAEDVVQEVVTAVYRAMPTFHYDRSKGTFRAYLRTITQRKVADHMRKAGRGDAMHAKRPVPEDGLPDPDSAAAEELWEQDWRRNLLQVCLERVSQEVEPKTFQAFQLFALEDWSVADTAAFLKMKPAAVYVAKSRVAARVRTWFERELGVDEKPDASR